MTKLDECIGAVAKNLNLKAADVREITKALRDEHKRLSADSQITRADQALQGFANAKAEEARIQAALKRKQAAVNIINRDAWDADVGAMREKGMTARAAVIAKLVGHWRGVTMARKSAAFRRISLEGGWIGGIFQKIMADPELRHVMKMMRNPKAATPLFRDVIREMAELKTGGSPGKTGNGPAQKLARIFATVLEAARLEANKVGANIGRIDGWTGPQSHDAQKLLAMRQEKWIEFIKPLLDHAQTFGEGATPKEIDEFLNNVYLNITTGRDLTLTAARKGERTGPANLARSMEKHRVLHFKDADAWLAYNDQLGRGSVVTGMLDHLAHMARKVSLMQVMGPNPEVFLESVLEKLRDDVRKDAAAGKLTAEQAARQIDDLRVDLSKPSMSYIGRAFAEVMGDTHVAAHQSAARIMGNIRVMQSIGKLGMAVVSSFSDLMTFAHNMRFQGKGVLSAYGDAFRALLAGRQTNEQRQLAMLLGVGYDTILGDMHSRYWSGDALPGKFSRAQDIFFRLSGLTGWTDRLTNAFARMNSAWLAQHAHLTSDELPLALRHSLSLYGLDGERWELARQAVFKAEDGQTYLVPDKIQELDLEAFRNLVPANLKGQALERRLERARNDLELDLRAHYADQAAYGVLKADDATRTWTTLGTQRGSFLGEAIRMIAQFKSFPIAYMQRTLMRTLRGGPGGKVDVVGLAELTAASILFGYASMTAKDFLKNKTPKDPFAWKTFLAAMVQGGGAGIYGDFLFAQSDRFGNGPLETLAGPTLGAAANVVQLWNKVMNGDSKRGDWVYFALNNAPYVNLWYSRAAFDLLVGNALQEWASPGVLKRREKTWRRESGQQFIYQPEAAR